VIEVFDELINGFAFLGFLFDRRGELCAQFVLLDSDLADERGDRCRPPAVIRLD
jgi:hypothetical protein